MAIVRDTFSSFVASTTGSLTVSFSYTTAGTNTCVLIFAFDESGDSVTSAAYGAGTSTQLCKHRNGAAGTGELYVYGLLNPAGGSQTVKITRTGTSGKIYGGAISYTGVSQSGIPDATITNGTGASSSISATITTATANAVVTGTGCFDNGSIAASTNLTAVGTAITVFGSANALNFFESSTFPIVSPGGYAMTLTGGAGSNATMAFVSLAPFVQPTYITYRPPWRS